MGTKFPASSLKEEEVQAYREIERQDAHKILDEYLLICRRMGVWPLLIRKEKFLSKCEALAVLNLRG